MLRLGLRLWLRWTRCLTWWWRVGRRCDSTRLLLPGWRRCLNLWACLSRRVQVGLWRTSLLLASRGASRGSGPPMECQSRVSRITANLVLQIIDEVPSLHKVTPQILHGCTVQAHGYIRPSHPRHGLSIQLVILPVNDILEIKDARIVVILAREHSLAHIRGV